MPEPELRTRICRVLLQVFRPHTKIPLGLGYTSRRVPVSGSSFWFRAQVQGLALGEAAS